MRRASGRFPAAAPRPRFLWLRGGLVVGGSLGVGCVLASFPLAPTGAAPAQQLAQDPLDSRHHLTPTKARTRIAALASLIWL
jgi:hypothetical protein